VEDENGEESEKSSQKVYFDDEDEDESEGNKEFYINDEEDHNAYENDEQTTFPSGSNDNSYYNFGLDLTMDKFLTAIYMELNKRSKSTLKCISPTSVVYLRPRKNIRSVLETDKIVNTDTLMAIIADRPRSWRNNSQTESQVSMLVSFGLRVKDTTAVNDEYIEYKRNAINYPDNGGEEGYKYYSQGQSYKGQYGSSLELDRPCLVQSVRKDAEDSRTLPALKEMLRLLNKNDSNNNPYYNSLSKLMVDVWTQYLHHSTPGTIAAKEAVRQGLNFNSDRGIFLPRNFEPEWDSEAIKSRFPPGI
jgi:hypothetical protein